MLAKMFLVSQPSHLLLHHTPLRFFFGAWRRAGLIEPIVVYVVVVVVVVVRGEVDLVFGRGGRQGDEATICVLVALCAI